MRQASGIAATVFGILVGLTSSAPAQAQCSFGCNRYEQGQCVEYRECSPWSSAPTASYGAIAYGRTSRAWGYSDRWGSQAKAESVAVQNCAQRGNDCEVMVWFEHKCGAVALGEGTAAFGGLGNSDGQARADAQSKCVNSGGAACQIQVSQCSN